MSNQPEYPPPPVTTEATGAGTPATTTAPPRTTNGLAIAGFVLAILIAPIGLILSIIGLVQAGRRGQKGKGLAVAGIIIAVLLTGIGAVAAIAAGGTVSRLADPGCTTGRNAVLDNADMSGDREQVQVALQTTINGLNSAASKARHDDVRQAMTNLANDYGQLLQAVKTGTPPDPGLENKITEDAKKVDSLCSIGGE